MKKSIKIFLSIIASVLVSNTLIAQDIVKGQVVDEQNKPIWNAYVVWLDSDIGTSTDEDGKFSLSRTEVADITDKLVISMFGYETKTILVQPNQTNSITIILKSLSEKLDGITIEQRRKGTINNRSSFINLQTITKDELRRAACCNLSESFETNPSVDVAYSDAATGAKQIKLLGLSGTYVQMLTENIPNLKGIAAPYGLGYIPGPWMESISISKGTGSVINGYESVTGQINIEYKKPNNADKVSANLFASDAGRVEANVDMASVLDSNLSTGLFLHVSDEFLSNDRNGDNFMDMPRIKQLNALNRWYFTKGNYLGQVLLNALVENRMGGQMNVQNPYEIGVETERYQLFAKNAYIFDARKEQSIGLILNGTWHRQDAHFGKNMYEGKQGTLYSNLIFQTKFTEKHKLSTGLSFNYDNFDEHLHNIAQGDTTKITNKKDEFTTGIFAEYTYILAEKFVFLAGARGDYNAFFNKFLFTPRIHIRYMPWEFLCVRLSAGRGYRTANLLAENNYLLASSRKFINQLGDNSYFESAWNWGVHIQNHIPVGRRELSLQVEFYHTDFDNQVIADLDGNAHAVEFEALNGKSYSNNFQIEANMEVIKNLNITAACRYTDAKTTISGVLSEKPFTPRWRVLFTASYATKFSKWQFDCTLQANGSGRLPTPDKNNPLWQKDFKPFVIMNSQITRNFKHWSIYIGCENMLDFMQKNPIIDAENPFSNDFDATMIWGTTHGRKIYAGFRCNFK